MSKNVLIAVLSGVFAAELFFFGGRDLLHLFSRIGIREITIVLLIVGATVLDRVIRQAARRL